MRAPGASFGHSDYCPVMLYGPQEDVGSWNDHKMALQHVIADVCFLEEPGKIEGVVVMGRSGLIHWDSQPLLNLFTKLQCLDRASFLGWLVSRS